MKKNAAIIGAAFLMATSAIGPGFITQTTVFTRQLLSSFGFVIIISILLDIAAQLNIWRIITVKGKRAQDIANELMPGMGYVLSFLIVFGGFAFNIGNIAGCGLGLNILVPLDRTLDLPAYGAWASAAIGIFILWFNQAGKALDLFTRVMGILMIALTLWIVLTAHPPYIQVLRHSLMPETTDLKAIITLVGGTVGGYISYAGAHRLIDAGITGQENTKEVSAGSIRAVLIASVMRVLLFLAALGVIINGGILDDKNPAASVFRIAAGNWGYWIFGIVLWSASITSVVGSAYTSISFIKSLHPSLEKNQRLLTSLFILLSTFVLSYVGKPVKLLILAGALNGLILPVSLGIILLAPVKKGYLGTYRHPKALLIAGWLVVLVMAWLSAMVLKNELPGIL